MMRLFGCLLALMLLGAGMAARAQEADTSRDPLERVNRAIYSFNSEVDRVVLRPLAEGYVRVIPEPARNCVGNVFSNLGDVGNAVNNALQGKLGAAFSDLCRLAINSTLGIFGCFDVATELGLEKHKEDFGQTLAVWGVGPGPYIVLPFLGPSSLRDTFGLFSLDSRIDVVRNLDHVPTRNEFMAVRIVDQRAGLLTATNILENAALDPYVFVRDAYFQRRRAQIFDGDPPEEGGKGSGGPGPLTVQAAPLAPAELSAP